MHLSLPRSWNLSRAKLVLLALLLLLLLFGSAPGYLSRNWVWRASPEVVPLTALRQVRQKGIPIADWKIDKGEAIALGEHKWYMQDLSQGKKTATVFLLPQTTSKSKPEVEWSDLEGAELWKSDGYQTLKLSIAGTNQTIEARFFRAWTRSKTYAVVQWYAQPQGGSAAPSQWFWADQRAQWQGKRVPWVAVSIKIPMEPLGDVSKLQPDAESLAQTVQKSLNSVWQ
jgi:cyanoexosortase B-associated protein